MILKLNKIYNSPQSIEVININMVISVKIKDDSIANLNIQVPEQELKHAQRFWSQTGTL